MKPPPLIRSALYVPASNARAIEKARGLDSDAVIIDLEDAVAPDAKEAARKTATEIPADTFPGRTLVIRVNGLDTPWGAADIEAAARSEASAILVPKINRTSEIEKIDTMLARSRDDLAIWAMAETCEILFALPEIARTAHQTRLACLVVGTNDLVKEMRALHVPGRANLAGMLSQIVAAARLGGIAVLDGVFNAITDETGFADECRQGRAFGFDGKTLIHPTQIAACHEAYSPSPEAIEEARQIADAFGLAENAGAGVIKVEGRMVERLHLEIAEALLEKAALIKARTEEEKRA